MAHLTLFLSLLALAALWPPYNILIARALGNRDYLTVALVPVASMVGLGIITGLLAVGSGITHLPLNLIGGILVVFLGGRMFFEKPAENNRSLTGNRIETLGTVFLVSFSPGVYSVTAALGIERRDFLMTALVFLAGPLFGITAGGFLLHHGFRATRLPLPKIGGVILFGIGLWMLMS